MNEAPEGSAQAEWAQSGTVRPEPAEPAAPAKAKRTVIRIPGTAILVIALLTFSITPIAWTVPGMFALYALPAALLYWVLRVRTIATPDGLRVRGLVSTHQLSWSELRGLSISDKGRISAVTVNDATVTLPATRSHHLPTLSFISGGRLPDPTGLTTDFT